MLDFIHGASLMMEDHWVSTDEGSEHNYPRSIDGTIEDECFDPKANGWYRLMSTGRLYFRHDCYWPDSPYGWNEV